MKKTKFFYYFSKLKTCKYFSKLKTKKVLVIYRSFCHGKKNFFIKQEAQHNCSCNKGHSFFSSTKSVNQSIYYFTLQLSVITGIFCHPSYMKTRVRSCRNHVCLLYLVHNICTSLILISSIFSLVFYSLLKSKSRYLQTFTCLVEFTPTNIWMHIICVLITTHPLI